jgi:hypothetical protein
MAAASTRSGWPDNQTYRNLVAWAWDDEERCSLLWFHFSDRRP